MIVDVSGILPENANKDKKIPEGSYITEQGNMTTDTPVQFLKLPETEKSDNQVHNVPLIPIPSPKPKVTETKTTTQKIVPVPTRKPLPENATLEQMLQRYILEHSPNMQQNLPQLNSTNSYKTELGNMTTDVPIQFVGNQYISDEGLYVKMWENIKRFEDIKYHPYLDTKGLITIGAGANVNDWNVFKNLNVTVNGIPATETQKWEAYNRMRQLSEEKDANGNYVNHNLKAKAFRDKTNIRITDAEARDLAQSHMNNDLAHLRREFSDFDNFPLPLKEVLLDIQYNRHNWPNLYRAIRNRDVNGIVDNVNRPDVGQDRNDWAKRMVRSIKF